jgi:hypothetical protein
MDATETNAAGTDTTQAGATAARGADAHLAMAQGLFYVGTGVWPIVSLKTFMMVTGPKVDGWLVKTVGALLTVVGAALYRAGKRNRVSQEIAILGAGCAVALTAVDVYYVARRRIAKVYLLDALAETGLLVAWGALARPLARRA